jgi:hypothetical protein
MSRDLTRSALLAARGRTLQEQPGHLKEVVLNMRCVCVAAVLMQDILKVKDPPEPTFEAPAADDLVAAPAEMFFSKPQQLLQVRQTCGLDVFVLPSDSHARPAFMRSCMHGLLGLC